MDAERSGEPRVSFGLERKLLLAFGLVGCGVLAWAIWFLAPSAERRFERNGEELVDESAEAWRALQTESIDEIRDLLQHLIDHTTETRARTLEDLPLSLYGADPRALREAVRREDVALGERLGRNTEILARELNRRLEERLGTALQGIVEEQRERAASFAEGARKDFLWLSAGAFLALFGLLGFGTWRSVVRPVTRLRDGARKIAGGDLDVEVDTRGHDEVSALAVEFGEMVRQLREARSELHAKNAELSRWNETLSTEVERKTAHLEEAMTELQGAQAQLVHAAKMSSVGTLAGGVAHEFGNLIAGIQGCAKDALEEEDDPERRETLELIHRTAVRADKITRGLLRFSRREVAGEAEVDLHEVIDDAVQLVTPQARRMAVEVVAREGAPALCRGDAGSLQQVFVNLLTNALQASEEGGKVEIGVVPEGDEYVVVVRDSGHGIPKQDLGSIFDPFFTTKDKETDVGRRGTGLGLSVSFGVIESHGGRIEVRSEVSEGSEFRVVLPRASASMEET